MLTDVIAAPATPPGRSALAVVRVSGAGAFEVAARVVRGFQSDRPRVATLATFHDAAGEPIDRGLYTVFPAPASYTGDDLIELSCHGGTLIPARLLAALEAAGARPAHPGEFTRRAVLNGKLDLVQAEAVGDLIDATATAQGRAALRQLDGALSRRLAALRDGLVEAQALLSYDIDFPDEDDGPVPPERIAAQVRDVAEQIDRLLATAPAGERLREGALVVLAGRPNTGKSSLVNALLGSERVLVTELPGTTRDAIEVHTEFCGWPVRLVDTAGIWESSDRIDRLGIEVSRRYLAAADLVLFCAEAGRALGADEAQLLAEHPNVLVRTKADLAGGANGGTEHAITVSTVTGQGLDAVKRAVADRAFGGELPVGDWQPALSRERHRAALARAAAALAEVQLGAGADPVLAAHHVREATLALDELIGAVDVEQVLDRVFGTFCVGK